MIRINEVCTCANKCRSGESTIWPLRLRTDGHEKRMATIEASPRQRAIVQVRARHNRPPGKRSSEIIRNWAAWAGLHVRTRLGPEAALGGVL